MNITREEADLIFAEDEKIQLFYSVGKYICNKAFQAVAYCVSHKLSIDNIIDWHRKENVC